MLPIDAVKNILGENLRYNLSYKRYNWRLSSELNFEPRRRIKVNYDAKTSEKILAGYFKWKLMISRGKQKRNYSWEIVNSRL